MKSGILPPNIYTNLGIRSQFYPPPANCVLYLPGYPPMGGTNYDFSNVFYDSTVNTNEELDNSETGVDCDVDATTLIPVGSVIRVESEQMLVSATGTTLTVSRGYNGTAPATHATAQDISRLTTNHGAITQAVWTRLSSGGWALDYDGADDTVTVTSSASIQLTNSLTIICWAYVDAFAPYNTLVTKLTAWSQGYWFSVSATGMQLQWADSVLGGTGAGSDATTNNITTWYQFGVVKNGQDVLYYKNGAKVGDTKTTTGGTILTGTTNMQIGGNQASHSTDFYNGKIALPRILNAPLTTAQVLGYFQQERHLFGV